jgi:two-component system NtrC family sensor kinase
VKKRLDGGLPEIVASRDQLQQVFMNLTSNAAEAMEANRDGCLTVSTAVAEKNAGIKIRFQDNGVGIPKENQPRLFEPFFTTKKRGKGVGLGLSVVYGIIQEHGGTIRVSSDEKHGTLFELSLPLRKPSLSQKEGVVAPGAGNGFDTMS